MEKKKIDMLTGSPLKSVIRFALPIMASSMLQYNYSLIDNIIVGRYVSSDALVVVNFILDLLFVKTFRWGVEGAAVATLISHIVACTLNGIYVIRFNKEVDIKKKDLRLEKAASVRQIKLGLPVSLQFTVTSIGSMCLQSVVNSFGTSVIAGFTAAGRVEQLTNIPMSGLGVANQTSVGQNYGARNYKRILSSVKKIFLLDICISVVMSIILYTIGEPVVSLFMTEDNPEILAAAKRYILAIAQCYSLVAILFVMRNTLQGLGFTYANSIAGIGELFGRLAIAFIFTPVSGFDAVCYAGPAAWLLADIPLIIIYLHKSRQFRKISENNSTTVNV